MTFPVCTNLPTSFTVISDGFTYVLVDPTHAQLTGSWQVIPKTFKANVSQNGTDDPIINTVWVNTLGGVPELVFDSNGVFNLNLDGAFGDGVVKTNGLCEPQDSPAVWEIVPNGGGSCAIRTYDEAGGSLANSKLNQTLIEVLVFPA